MPLDTPSDTDTQRQIHGRLGALTNRLKAFHTVDATLKDDRIRVVGVKTRRRVAVTCAPRVDDQGVLWFFDGHGNPIIEAANVTDAAVHVTALVQEPR